MGPCEKIGICVLTGAGPVARLEGRRPEGWGQGGGGGGGGGRGGEGGDPPHSRGPYNTVRVPSTWSGTGRYLYPIYGGTLNLCVKKRQLSKRGCPPNSGALGNCPVCAVLSSALYTAGNRDGTVVKRRSSEGPV